MQNHGVRLMRLFCSLMGVHLVMLPRRSQILLGARGFAFSRFRRASAAWRRLGAFALSRETALARENADFSSKSDFLAKNLFRRRRRVGWREYSWRLTLPS
jgi:hypothetical protein